MSEPEGGRDDFRHMVRDWLETNLPARLKGKSDLNVEAIADDVLAHDVALWRQRLGEKGWGVPTWPAVYGGGALSADEASILREEMARIGACNPIGGIGAWMLGPTLLEYGTEDQKQRHLPPIARGDIRWCECYSEPGAGSDLANLQTKCEDAGDHWLINGQKIWTSGAQFADWCFCLVRTDRTKKHGGISFVVINMHQPGIEVRPIKLISGLSPFCETFFTDRQAPPPA
jgi:alkylation response protein AidB-like acyl-CoA dehydrogenase